MILKIAILFGGGYLVFRLLKASLKHTLLDLLQPKEEKGEADGASELVQCTECQSFTDGEKAIYRRKMVFCSTKCLDKHFSKNG